MAGILGRTRDLLGRGKPVAPIPFHVRCTCGEQLEGIRQPEFQIFTCPSCGESLCIFPQSPLAEPVDPTRPKSSDSEERPKAKAPSSRSKPVPQTREVQSPTPTFAERTAPLRRQLTIPRLVLASVCLVVAGTVWWQIVRLERNQLREDLIPRARKGLQSLQAGELDTAYEDLLFVRNALDRLGEPFPDEARCRQAYAELAAIHDLVSDPLDVTLSGGTDNPGRVSRSLQGKSIILDAMVERRSDIGWNVAFTSFMDDKVVHLHPDGITLFDHLSANGKTRVIFGARVDALQQIDGQWFLRLQPDSGVFLTERTVLEAISLANEPEAIAIAVEQKRIVEQKDESELTDTR